MSVVYRENETDDTFDAIQPVVLQDKVVWAGATNFSRTVIDLWRR